MRLPLAVTNIDIMAADGTNLGVTECPAGNLNDSCAGAYLALHLTPGSTAYLEVLFLPMLLLASTHVVYRVLGSGQQTTISISLVEQTHKSVSSVDEGSFLNLTDLYG